MHYERAEVENLMNRILDEVIDTSKKVESLLELAINTMNTGEHKELALSISGKGKEILEDVVNEKLGMTIPKLEEYCEDNHIIADAIPELKLYFKILKFEAYHLLDSYMLYIEKNRPIRERFYLPRRRTLKQVVDLLQELEDDKLDRVFIHMPPRVGKSGVMTMANAWHCSRNHESSNLYATFKESLGGSFLEGVIEIMTDPTYCHRDIFPDVGIVYTDAKNHKVDLGRRKKYKTLSGKGLESGLNGEYDCNGWMTIDDILEGIQDVLNPDILHRKQIVFNNNLMSRKKSGCKIIYNGTIWSLHDIYSNEHDFLENNPSAKKIRWKILKIPALNENDESNFDYDYGVGYSTQEFLTIRAKFEEDDDMASWYAQYQQEPIERDGAVFNPEHMKFYNGVLPKEEPFRICAACDVALGGADYLAFAVAYMYENGDIYIPDVIFDNSEKKFTKPKVIDMILMHNVGSAFFESNQGGEGYKDEVDKELREKGYKINLRSEYAPTNKRKTQRIWDKAGSIRDFYFLDAGCRSIEYRKFMTNLYSFTVSGKNPHEDAADCLASLAYFIEGTWSSAKIEIPKNPFRSGMLGGYY